MLKKAGLNPAEFDNENILIMFQIQEKNFDNEDKNMII